MKRLTGIVAMGLLLAAVPDAYGQAGLARRVLTRRLEVKMVAYPVRDLVRGPDAPESPRADRFHPVVDLLKTTVAPGTWTANGGRDGLPHAITASPDDDTLIIHATPAVHGQVRQRLDQIRRLPALRDRDD